MTSINVGDTIEFSFDLLKKAVIHQVLEDELIRLGEPTSYGIVVLSVDRIMVRSDGVKELWLRSDEVRLAPPGWSRLHRSTSPAAPAVADPPVDSTAGPRETPASDD